MRRRERGSDGTGEVGNRGEVKLCSLHPRECRGRQAGWGGGRGSEQCSPLVIVSRQDARPQVAGEVRDARGRSC